jgi:hypothetical protein
MAKKVNTTKVTVEVDPDNLGVTARHHFLMANDQDYRDRALTPPGGKAPGEDGKPENPTPEGSGLTAAALVASA